jgi:hypothetical protein
MGKRVALVIGMLVAGSLVGLGQQPAAPQSPRGQMPDLGRPTKGTDPLPLFDFDQYFIGSWTFEWEVPDGPLGPGGQLAGTTTYKPIGGRFYEAMTEATGPLGPFTITELIAYERENKTLARHVADSRGFAFLQIGPIGGDLGGYYNIHFESAPFVYAGRTVRLKHIMRLLSPTNYRLAATVSVDGGAFVNFGTPWFRKTGG